MKNILKSSTLLIIVLSVLLVSCQNETSVNNNKADNTEKAEKAKPTLTPVATPITTTCLIQIEDPENDWEEEWYRNVDVQKLSSFVFNAIYAGKLSAYDYRTGEKMPIDSVKAFEADADHDRKLIGKALFTEDWFIDDKNVEMVKKVNSVMLAYHIKDAEGNIIGHRPGIQVYFNGTEPTKN